MSSTESRPPLILISNDDGFSSPGLWALVEAAQPLGDVLVAAPMHQQSGASRSRIVSSDAVQEEMVLVNGQEVSRFALDMTPAQCVYHGVTVLASRRPSLVISGINYGENLGTGITGSGTVGAALEGAAWRIPSIAASLETGPEYHLNNSPEVDFEVAAYVVAGFARRVLALGLPEGVDLLKIDLPKGVTRRTPWQLTRQSRKRNLYLRRDTGSGYEHVLGRRDKGSGAAGEDLSVYERVLDPNETEPDSDIWALFVERVISVCPLTTDLTARLSPGATDALLGR